MLCGISSLVYSLRRMFFGYPGELFADGSGRWPPLSAAEFNSGARSVDGDNRHTHPFSNATVAAKKKPISAPKLFEGDRGQQKRFRAKKDNIKKNCLAFCNYRVNCFFLYGS